jgi:hypothetical protein
MNMPEDREQLVKDMLRSGIKKIEHGAFSGSLVKELAGKLVELEKQYENELKGGDTDEQADYTVSFYHNFTVSVFNKLVKELFSFSEYAPLLEDDIGELYGIQK